MRVAIVSGSWPPARCGVGDYSAGLARALENTGVSVLRLPAGSGCPPATAARRFALNAHAAGAELIHVQYPAMGFGRSLFPALVALASPLPVVATLHEFSIFRSYRLPWFAPYALAAHTIIFTSDKERAQFRRRLPFGGAKHALVPIGSNIGRGQAGPRDTHAVCFFGLLMPGKNIESFLDLAGCLQDGAGGWRLHLIGAIPDAHRAYAANLLKRAQSLGIALHLELPADDVADLLASMAFAYLPFPGGADETRGSLLAALDNGVHVLTTVADHTPHWIAGQVTHAASPRDAARLLSDLRPPPAMPTASADAAYGWDAIAEAHVRIYDDAVHGYERAHA